MTQAEVALAMPVAAAIMRAADTPLTIEPVALGPIAPHEVRVRLVATGICHTDLAVLAGMLPVPTPVVLGHEGAGIVAEVGESVRSHTPGDHVVLSFGSCGACDACHAGTPGYCSEFNQRNFACCRPDGTSSIAFPGDVRSHFFSQSSFAGEVVCPARNAIVVPADVPLETLAPLGCGVLTGAGAVCSALAVRPGSSLAVVGSGAVGLSAVMAAKLVGASIITAVDRVAHRLALASELGATHVVDTGKVGLDEGLALSCEGGYDYILDTTGSPALIAGALKALGRRGTLALVAPGPDFTASAMELIGKGCQVRGIVEGDVDPAEFIPRLVDWYREGRLPIDRLIRFYPFERINEAIAAAASGETVKPVLLAPVPA